MQLVNCEINLILTWSEDCLVSSAAGTAKFQIAYPKLYVPFVILLTHVNAKLLQKLKWGFKRSINWNKYQPKVSPEVLNKSLYFLIDPSFQGVNRLFVLSFENENEKSKHRILPSKSRNKNYNVMIDGMDVFDQPVKYDLRIYEKLQIVKDMITLLLDYNCFNK